LQDEEVLRLSKEIKEKMKEVDTFGNVTSLIFCPIGLSTSVHGSPAI
jgi:hypothetical protein